MIEVINSEGKVICARCGCNLTKGKNCDTQKTADHFIPRCYVQKIKQMSGIQNKVTICRKCNGALGNKLKLPQWYSYLAEEDIKQLSATLDKFIKLASNTSTLTDIVNSYKSKLSNQNIDKQQNTPTVESKSNLCSDGDAFVLLLLNTIKVSDTVKYKGLTIQKTTNGFNIQ